MLGGGPRARLTGDFTAGPDSGGRGLSAARGDDAETQLGMQGDLGPVQLRELGRRRRGLDDHDQVTAEVTLQARRGGDDRAVDPGAARGARHALAVPVDAGHLRPGSREPGGQRLGVLALADHQRSPAKAHPVAAQEEADRPPRQHPRTVIVDEQRVLRVAAGGVDVAVGAELEQPARGRDRQQPQAAFWGRQVALLGVEAGGGGAGEQLYPRRLRRGDRLRRGGPPEPRIAQVAAAGLQRRRRSARVITSTRLVAILLTPSSRSLACLKRTIDPRERNRSMWGQRVAYTIARSACSHCLPLCSPSSRRARHRGNVLTIRANGIRLCKRRLAVLDNRGLREFSLGLAFGLSIGLVSLAKPFP